MPLLAALLFVSWLVPVQTPAPAPAASQAATAALTVVRSLYTDHLAHDMAFTRATVGRKSRWLAPALDREIQAWFRRPVSPDQAPNINGDPFTDTQEYPTAFVVGDAVVRDDTTTVPVTFTIGNTTRVVQVRLTRFSAAWLVADLLYDDGGTFRQQLASR